MLLDTFRGFEDYYVYANYRNQCALLQGKNEEGYQFAVVNIDARGGAFNGYYTPNRTAAEKEFIERSFCQFEVSLPDHDDDEFDE